MAALQNDQETLQETQAWKFAGLVQSRLTDPVHETVIAKPTSLMPGLQDWNGGIFTYVAPTGEQVRVGRTRNGVERGGETWVDYSSDGGKTWERKTSITKDDERAGGKEIASVERPYIYGKIVDGEQRIVLGTCAAEKDSKCWDTHEREVPLARLEQLKTAPVNVVLAGEKEFAYKDGVPIQSPDGNGIYLGVTRHHIGGTPESAVNADTVLAQLDEKTGKYDILDVLLQRGARDSLDATCNRLSAEMVFPDGSRFWSRDIRNVEEPNAALKTPLTPGKPDKWKLGDFDEITSFAVAQWGKGADVPQVTLVPAILGRSTHPRYPTLRYLGIALLDAKGLDDAAMVLTYEKASATGSKSTYQQTISKKELEATLAGKGPQLLLGQDPVA